MCGAVPRCRIATSTIAKYSKHIKYMENLAMDISNKTKRLGRFQRNPSDYVHRLWARCWQRRNIGYSTKNSIILYACCCISCGNNYELLYIFICAVSYIFFPLSINFIYIFPLFHTYFLFSYSNSYISI